MMKYDTRLLCKQQIRAGLSYSFEPYRLQARVNCYEDNGLQKQRFRIRINLLAMRKKMCIFHWKSTFFRIDFIS